jgi:hypothetical protein
MCAHILDCAPAGDGALSDDTALLVVRHVPVDAPLEDGRCDVVVAAGPVGSSSMRQPFGTESAVDAE